MILQIGGTGTITDVISMNSILYLDQVQAGVKVTGTRIGANKDLELQMRIAVLVGAERW